MRHRHRLIPPLLLFAFLAGDVTAQGMPTSQPGVLTIIIEELKTGAAADHEANEAGWPAAFARANSPYYYLALESMTGSPEIWFVVPYASWSAEGESMKVHEGNPTLMADMQKLAREDAKYLNGIRTVQAVARPDLSYGAFPDLGAVRFYEVTTFRVRPGHEQAFEAAARVYQRNVQQRAPGMSYRMYQVTGGMPGGHYLIFGSSQTYAEFDSNMAEGNAMWASISAEDMATLERTMRDDVMMTLTNRYRVSPKMSYVSADTRSKDVAFWQ